MRIKRNDISEGGKIIQLIHDFVIREDVCNLSCDYCMTRLSPFLQSKQASVIGEVSSSSHSEKRPLDYLDPSLRLQMDATQDAYNRYFDAPILKVSGGEIFLIRNITKFLEREVKRYASIQILTNGTLLERADFDTLQSLGNVSFQVSLDGHTTSMNALRTRSKMLHERVLTTIRTLVERRFPLEIYCVVTRQNADGMLSFLEYLESNFGSTLCLIPFPARHKSGETFFPEKGQIEAFERILKNFDNYKDILPPLQYLELLRDHLLNDGKRLIRCYVPFLMLQSFNNGSVTPCPYNWVAETGNLVREPNALCNTYGVSNAYHMRTTEPPWAPFCKRCFTDAIVFSLYFEGNITLYDLVRNRPALQMEEVQRRLQTLKTVFQSIRPDDRSEENKGYSSP